MTDEDTAAAEARDKLLGEKGWIVQKEPDRWWNFPYNVSHDGSFETCCMTLRGARRYIRKQIRSEAKPKFWECPIVYRQPDPPTP